MNRKLRARVFNSVIGLVTAILILVFLVDYSDNTSLPEFIPEQAIATHSQYFLINTRSTEYDEQGLLSFTLFSKEIEHNPADDSADMKDPEFELFDAGQRQWTVTAQLGTISADGTTLDLQQRVTVTSEDRSTIMKTPQLTIYPDKKLAKTDKPVTLQNPYGFTRSVGLRADMNRKRVELLEDVRGQYRGVQIEDEQ